MEKYVSNQLEYDTNIVNLFIFSIACNEILTNFSSKSGRIHLDRYLKCRTIIVFNTNFSTVYLARLIEMLIDLIKVPSMPQTGERDIRHYLGYVNSTVRNPRGEESGIILVPWRIRIYRIGNLVDKFNDESKSKGGYLFPPHFHLHLWKKKKKKKKKNTLYRAITRRLKYDNAFFRDYGINFSFFFFQKKERKYSTFAGVSQRSIEFTQRRENEGCCAIEEIKSRAIFTRRIGLTT